MVDDSWYKNAVIYNLHLDMFMDADGDGVGDFKGAMQRLDYLQWLGVDALWLAPFQCSPRRDDGYDVSDYYAVDWRYGSVGDFVAFVREARRRGIRVLMDLVVNHTSNEHPWFLKARSNPRSRYRKWYVWSTTRPRDWNRGMVFPGIQKSVWTYDAVARAYYRHRFYEFQPDLNTRNPEVRAEIQRIMAYWLDLGIDGFRVDAVPFILEPKRSVRSRVAHFEYIVEMRKQLNERAPHAVLLGEANVRPAHNRKYFGYGRPGLHMMFNFHVNQHLFSALASGDARPLAKALRATQKIPMAAQWAVFLRNHDELDLSGLSSKRSSVVFERFGPEPQMRVYRRGIRRRLASMLNDPQHLEFAYAVLFSLPGAPVIHYGDEIGMGENLSLRERQCVRTPMQWSSARNAGFSRARRPVRGLVRRGPCAFPRVNVGMQRGDPHSLLNCMARLIRLRKAHPEIGSGNWKLLRTGSTSVMAICYSAQLGNSMLVVISNFSDRPKSVKLPAPGEAGGVLVDVMCNEVSQTQADGKHHVVLEQFDCRWYEYRSGVRSAELDPH